MNKDMIIETLIAVIRNYQILLAKANKEKSDLEQTIKEQQSNRFEEIKRQTKQTYSLKNA